MNLLDALKRVCGMAPVLRNKPGGMAWVQSGRFHSGAEKLEGQAVRTASVDAEGYWRIEPRLAYITTAPQVFADGLVADRGRVVFIERIQDSALEPWKDTDITDEEVRELFAPNNKETA
jgi:hypothetical protein